MKIEDIKCHISRFPVQFEFLKNIKWFVRDSNLESSENFWLHCIINVCLPWIVWDCWWWLQSWYNAGDSQSKSKNYWIRNNWRDKDLSKALKICIMKVLVWTTVNYGAEGWTLQAKEKKKIQSEEIWFCQRLLNVNLKNKRTHNSILNILIVKR